MYDIMMSLKIYQLLHFSAQLLDAASKVLPLVVSVSGRVGSETPINCEYSGLRGVIVEQTVHGLSHHEFSYSFKITKPLLRKYPFMFQAEQHFLKHNDAGSWIQDSALMLSMCKEVPWYLVSFGSLISGLTFSIKYKPIGLSCNMQNFLK